MSHTRTDSGSTRQRKTTASYGHRMMSMDAIGWLIALLLLVVALPVLPVLLIGWALFRVLGFAHRNVLGD
jgi:hypothetical protein